MKLLTAQPDGSLAGMRRVALLSIGLSAFVPVFLFLIETRVRRREAAGPGAPPTIVPPIAEAA